MVKAKTFTTQPILTYRDDKIISKHLISIGQKLTKAQRATWAFSHMAVLITKGKIK